MALFWTIKYGGAEKTLLGWKLAEDFSLSEECKGKATATFTSTERFDVAAGPQFTFDSQAELWWRTGGVPGAYTGGAMFFAGYFDSPKHTARQGEESVAYQLHSVWWKFERQQFKQHRNEFGGWIDGIPSHGPLLVDTVLPEVFLGEVVQLPTSVVWQPNGDTLREIVAWVNEVFNPTKRGATVGMNNALDVVQAGNIEPKVYVPIQRSGYLYCNEACFNVTRLQPDTVFALDTTTTPPTLNVRTMAKWNYATSPPTFVDYTNLDEVVVNLTLEQQREIERQQQDMRQLNGVIIHYKRMDMFDGVSWPQFPVDKFPLAINDFTPETSAHFVELSPANLAFLKCVLDCRPVADAADPSVGAADARKAWWLKHDKTLNSVYVDQASIKVTVATFTYEDGTPAVLATYPNELYGTMPLWTGFLYKRVTVKATASFDRYTVDVSGGVPAGAKPDDKEATREVSQEVTLTNAVSGPYQTISAFDSGEAVPVGVAEAVFRSVDVLQQAGTFTDITWPMRTDIRIGKRLKLVGPSHTWSNVFPQSVELRPALGEVSCTFGPSSPIDAAGLVELARATRWRTVYNMPSGRGTGTVSGTQEIDNTTKGQENNTAHGVGGKSRHGATKQEER